MTSDLLPEQRAQIIAWFETQIPFHRWLNLRIDVLERGHARLVVPWSNALIGDPDRPSVHGGITSALIDAAGGVACVSGLENLADRISTIDLRVDYLMPHAHQDIVCEATMVRVGTRIGVCRMDVRQQGQTNMVAIGQAAYSIVRSGA